jgi:histone deacetylase 11
MRIVYSHHYDITCFGLERLHPFDSRKHSKAWRWLRREAGATAKRAMVRVPRPIGRHELLQIHFAEYLATLRHSAVLADALELPIVRKLPAWAVDWRVLRPMRWATMGSVAAARAAREHGLAVNLAGGFHHAKPDCGEGFCVYGDVALAVHTLRSEGCFSPTERIVHIDLDAHQGNGVCHFFRNDRQVFLFDMYNSCVYPAYDRAARERLDCDLPLPLGCPGSEYLAVLRQQLPAFLDSAGKTQAIGLAIYNAGTDVFSGDPLGGLQLSAKDILERDLFVIGQLRDRGIPVVMLPSGGYTSQSYLLIARTVASLLRCDGAPAQDNNA